MKTKKKENKKVKSDSTKSTSKKRLYRSEKEKILGGVCGGISEYLDVDPTLVRLVWILFTLFYGVGLLVYVLLWIITPNKKNKILLND